MYGKEWSELYLPDEWTVVDECGIRRDVYVCGGGMVRSGGQAGPFYMG